jgi:phosphoribosylformylglycinamidine synthase
LNNEFTWIDEEGEKRSIAIPCSLLISAMGQIDDVATAVSMDLKRPDNAIYLIGATRNELGGSHAALVLGLQGGRVPKVDPAQAMRSYQRVHAAIQKKCIVSCHDASEGGLIVAIAEMAFAGEWGVEINLSELRSVSFVDASVLLFAESNSRLLCEVPVAKTSEFESLMQGVPFQRIGTVASHDRVKIECDGHRLTDLSWGKLRETWRAPLDFA